MEAATVLAGQMGCLCSVVYWPLELEESGYPLACSELVVMVPVLAGLRAAFVVVLTATVVPSPF